MRPRERFPTSTFPPETNGIAGMARVLLDTDVLVDHLVDPSRALSAELVSDAVYSSITRAELFSGQNADESVIEHLLANFEEVPVDRSVAEEAGRIRRIVGIKLPDALIAATAIVTKRTLLTRNLRDFRKVKRLKVHK